LVSPAPSFSTPDTLDPVAALRRATRAHHDRVDALVDVRRLRDGAHYARVLRALASFLCAWEPSVQAALPAWQGWLAARSRRAFLQQDLRHLRQTVPAPAPWPGFASPAAAWGSVYVIEGSALGGLFIGRSLAQAGVHAHNGAAYFNGWGGATARLWHETRDTLTAQLASQAALDEACGGARATFDGLSSLLESLPHERAALA
jgi:heme oxygenase